MRISLRLLIIPVIASLVLAVLPLNGLRALAGGDISVSSTGFGSSADRSGYGPLFVEWLNTGASTVTLVADDGSWSLAVPSTGDKTASKNFSTTSGYHIDGLPSQKGTITVFGALTKGAVSSTSASFSWGAATGASSYDILRNGSKIASQAGTTYTDTGLTPSTTYSYSIATDTYAGGSLSITTSPNAPTQLSATVSGSNAVLTWTAGQSSDRIAGYQVYLGGTQLGSTDSSTLKFTATGLKSGTNYSYTVRTLDKAGQLSADSNTAVVLIAANATPSPTPTPAKASPTPTVTPSPTDLPEETPTPSAGTPSLTKIKVDDTTFTPSPTDVLKFTAGKTLHLEGTTTPNTDLQISVYSQKETYQVTSDSKGAWQVDIATADLEAGNHQVTAALKDANGQAGSETSLLQFNLVGASTETSLTTGNIAGWTTLKWISLAIIIISLIGLLVSAFVLIRQRRLAKRRSTPTTPASRPNTAPLNPAITKAEPDTETPVETKEPVDPAAEDKK